MQRVGWRVGNGWEGGSTGNRELDTERSLLTAKGCACGGAYRATDRCSADLPVGGVPAADARKR